MPAATYTLQSPEQFGAYLRALRKSRGMTQRELGERLGVSAARVSEIERDPHALGLTQLLRLVHALGIRLVLDAGEPRTNSRLTSPGQRGEW